MSIAVLPAATVRAIGSTQVLTDASSVVKELVDNALDARASSVCVEISVNTLDIIRVIDNGHGIAPIDRGLICRRNCTSKITSFEDISGIGGRFLGFRGEALASMAELSGGVVVTTRIEGEPTATQMEMNRLGELVTQKQVSNAIGTSVYVKDFLKAIPVRREAALKGINKMYAKIKTTLQAYALARPLVRFSFKVLKAKNEKANWIYSPVPNIALSQAALRVLDQNAVKQCETQVWPPPTGESLESDPTMDEFQEQLASRQNFRIEALVPRVDYDLAAINNVGQFVSVDSRPVSCARGTFKSLKSLYRKYLQNATLSKGSTKLIDPILVLKVQCGPGSYDPNVEPAKDDVLFEDEAQFLQFAEASFRQLYGELKSDNHESRKKASDLGQSGFDLLLSRRLKPGTSTFDMVRQDQQEEPITPAKNDHVEEDRGTAGLKYFQRTSAGNARLPRCTQTEQDEDIMSHSQAGQESQHLLEDDTDSQERRPISPAGKPNMYTDDDDLFFSANDSTFPAEGSPIVPDEEQDTAARTAQTLNPWIVAKMNAPIQRRIASESDGEEPIAFTSQLPTPDRRHEEAFGIGTPGARSSDLPRQHQISLPTPSRSKPRHTDEFLPPSSSPLQRRQRLNNSGRIEDFVTQQTCVPQSLLEQVSQVTSTRQQVPHVSRPDQREGFVSARALPLELSIQSQSQPQSHPDLPLALDFERRKAHAVSQHRAQQRLFHQRPTHANSQYRQLDLSQDVRSTSPTSSPHANRYAKAVAALHATLEEVSTPKEKRQLESQNREIALDPKDARARLMRLQEQQKAGTVTGPAAQKLKRVKTSMLPFESVPVGEELYALSCTIDTSPMVISNVTSSLGIYEVEESGFTTPGFHNPDPDTLNGWEGRIKTAVREVFTKNRNLKKGHMRGAERDGTRSEFDDFEMDLQTLLGDTTDN